jgi:hypothetical protein
MLYRLLSVLGAFAHLGDAIVAPFVRFNKPRQTLRAAGARLSGALVIAIVLAIAAIAAVGVGNEGSANTSPTTYSIDQLSGSPDLGGKIYVTMSGVLDGDYVDTYVSDKYDSSDYLLCDESSLNCIVVVSKLPESDMARIASTDGSVTLTGMLRSDSKEVADALRTLGTKVSTLKVYSGILLRQGDTPANPTLMYGIAAIAGVLGLALLIGWAIGFLVFRPAKSRQGFSTSGMADTIPVKVTGIIPSFVNGIRAREKRAELRVPIADPGATPTGTQELDLVWTGRKGALSGLRLDPATISATIGHAYPFKGAKPALQIKVAKYKLILTFDSEQARDQAFDQFRTSAGLTMSPEGAAAAR